MMSDKEFNKLLEDDSQSDVEVIRRRRKRKTRDVVRNLFFFAVPLFKFFCDTISSFEIAVYIILL